MIQKPTVLITSLGRTGTLFFARLFEEVLAHSVSLHEPDLPSFKSKDLGFADLLKKVRAQVWGVGVLRILLPRLLGRPAVVGLSDARLKRSLEYAEAARELARCRARFVDSQDGCAYIESNLGYYGLLDVTPAVFEQHRVVYLVRDGRDWVRSNMNWGEMYGKGRLRGAVAHTWPTAADIGEDPYSAEWPTMSRFERLCWAWSRFNAYALGSVRENPQARVFCFEDIFTSEERYAHLSDLVNFATDLPGVADVPPRALEGWLDRRFHASRGDFPAWPAWSVERKQRFTEICGPLMETLGYDLD